MLLREMPRKDGLSFPLDIAGSTNSLRKRPALRLEETRRVLGFCLPCFKAAFVGENTFP